MLVHAYRTWSGTSGLHASTPHGQYPGTPVPPLELVQRSLGRYSILHSPRYAHPEPRRRMLSHHARSIRPPIRYRFCHQILIRNIIATYWHVPLPPSCLSSGSHPCHIMIHPNPHCASEEMGSGCFEFFALGLYRVRMYFEMGNCGLEIGIRWLKYPAGMSTWMCEDESFAWGTCHWT